MRVRYSWLLPQAPWNLKAPGLLKGGRAKPKAALLPAIGESHVRALSRPSIAELQNQGRTKALGWGMDSNMKERFLGVRGGPLGWGGGH